MKDTEKQVRPFGMKDKLAYAAGDFGCNMSFALKGTMMIFWTQFMGMGDSLYALLLLLVQIWDAINDPLIGGIIDSDKRKYKLGKFKSYVLLGSIGLLVAGALCFIPVPKAPMAAKIIIYIAGYVLWDAFYTIANVPYGSMLSLVSDDAGDRAQLSTWRSIGSMIGNIVAMAAIPMIIYDANDNILGGRVFVVALIMGVLGFIAFQYMIKNIELRVDDEEVKCNENPVKFNIFKAMINFFKNRPAVGATIAAMAMFLGMNSAASATTVLFQVYFNNAQASGIISVIGFLPMFFFMPFIRKIVNKWGKQEASVAGAVVSTVGALLLLLIRFNNPTIDLVWYILCMMIFGIGMGIYTCVSWSLMADAIDYNDWKNGTREEGTVYSLHSFFRKLAQGLGPSIILLIMVALGYNGAEGAAQTTQTALNMRYLIPGLYLFSGVMMLLGLGLVYNLNTKTLKTMQTELAARRNNNEVTEETQENEETVEETEEPKTILETTEVPEDEVEVELDK